MDERLQQIFAELFKVPPARYSDALSPDDVKGWDSLGHLSLVDSLEAAFGITFEDGDLTELENVGRIKAILRQRGAQG